MPTNADAIIYLDASAVVKLVIGEPESEALERYLRRRPRRASCALIRTEVVRAVRPHGDAAIARAYRLIALIDLVRIEEALLDSAALVGEQPLRTLDAIHLAAAQTFGAELAAIVTYDDRMSAAARELRLPVDRPA